MTTMISVDGREFQVERITVTSVMSPSGRTEYRLTGKRGAVYETMRNANHPSALFVLIGSGRNPRTFWFSDARGELEAVDSMGHALRIAAEVTRTVVTSESVTRTDPKATAEVQRLERELAKAQAKSTRAMEARMNRPVGTSRARATTLNANWARAAEQRDRVAAALDAARERVAVAE